MNCFGLFHKGRGVIFGCFRNSMQKPKRGRSLLAFSAVNSMLKNRLTRKLMPATLALDSIYKGGGRSLREVDS